MLFAYVEGECLLQEDCHNKWKGLSLLMDRWSFGAGCLCIVVSSVNARDTR